MQKRVLITGGAGFIGSHLADELVDHGYRVRVLDNLSPQVHGSEQTVPEYLNDEVELIRGDVRDPDDVQEALEDVDAVYHLAASVGVGQSMYEIEEYTDVNTVGTGVLLEALIDHPVERLVVASSMSLYGEGLYETADGAPQRQVSRTPDQLERGEWELRDRDGRALQPVATPESKPPTLASVYALSKFDQERLSLMVGQTYDIPTVALRFFNVFGRRQALSNPYTGVLAIFGSRYLNENPPVVFEDGHQKRDFVHVSDVARACRQAIEKQEAVGQIFNIGSGRAYSILEVAEAMGRAMEADEIEPQVTGEYRAGDIRHCFADISKARRLLDYEPRVDLEEGLDRLADWMQRQTAEDRVDEARQELSERGLTLRG